MSSSEELFERAQQVIPGGVNSPVRAFQSVGGHPRFMQSGSGARMCTVDGDSLVDFCGSWGPLILGHARPEVVDAAQAACANGMTFGASTEAEVRMAELLTEMIPSMEMVRLVNSGTEATMSALRLARGFTGRDKVLKFDGCYHGHADFLLVAAGSGLLTGGVSSSAGVSDKMTEDVLIAPYNDIESVRNIVAAEGESLAAIVLEPVAGNMGLIQPEEHFLQELRELCDRCGALLMFDEVITGFRFGPTSYGEIAGVRPDLTCLGKIVGGGLPIGAFGGRTDIMKMLAPLGPVYQAGTLSGNPVAVAAGHAALTILKDTPPYAQLDALGAVLEQGLSESIAKHGVPAHCARLGGVFTVFFRPDTVRNLADAKECNTELYASFFNGLLERGYYIAPSQFEVGFLNAAHTEEDVRGMVAACDSVFSSLSA